MATESIDTGSQNFQTRNAMVRHNEALYNFAIENKDKLATFDTLQAEEKQKLLADFKAAAGINQRAEMIVNIQKRDNYSFPVSAALLDSAGNQLSVVTLSNRIETYTAESFQMNANLDREFKAKAAKFATENLVDIRNASVRSSFLGLPTPGIDGMRRESLNEKLGAIFGDARVDNLFTTTDGRTGISGYVWSKNNSTKGPQGYFEIYIDRQGKVSSLIEPVSIRDVDSSLKLGDFPASFRKGKAIFTTNAKADLNGDGLLTRDEIIKSKDPSLSPPSSIQKDVAEKNATNISNMFNSLPPEAQSKVLSTYHGSDVKIDLKLVPNSSVEPLARQFIAEGKLGELNQLLASRTEAEEVRLLKLFAKEIVSMERKMRK